ncbi:MAG: ribosome biogenesis GTP-binding protein YihA/YsxC, partial [Spirochaetota bacterium]
MKINKAEFIKSAVKPEQYPQLPYPEFAFAGRSNVGKSSLINMVTGNSRLVKVGSKPGVTKTINFFSINDTICMADLPGYGYAKVPMELKKQFYPMIKLYFSNRDRLKLVFLLIDIRRVPGDFEKE